MRQKLSSEIENLIKHICTDEMPARVLGIYGYGEFLTNELADRADLIIRYSGEDKPSGIFLNYVEWINSWKNGHDNGTPLSVLKNHPAKVPNNVSLWISKCTWDDIEPKRLDVKIRLGHSDQIFKIMTNNNLWSQNPTVSIQSWIPESISIDKKKCKLIWSAANKDVERNLCSQSIEILGIREMQELISLSQRNDYMAACISALRISKNHNQERQKDLVEKMIVAMPTIQDTLCDLPDRILNILSMFGTQEINAMKIVLKEAKIRIMVQPYFLRALVEFYLRQNNSKGTTINNILSEFPECSFIPRSGLYLAVKPYVDYMNTGNEDSLNLIKIGQFFVKIKD